jgi:uncharacterized protein
MSAPVTVPDTDQWTWRPSQIDHEYQLWVALPEGYGETSGDYPWVLLLDADFGFGLARDTAILLAIEGLLPPLVIVGISYGSRDVRGGNKRWRDLTPTSTAVTPSGGGADQFLEALREDLIPAVESRYRVRADRTIAGASLGGLFSLFAMFRSPGLFQRYLVISAAMHWDGGLIFEYERELAENGRTLEGRVFLSVGGLEPASYTGPFHRLSDRLRRAYPGLVVCNNLFELETHTSVQPAALSRGLRFLFEETRVAAHDDGTPAGDSSQSSGNF